MNLNKIIKSQDRQQIHFMPASTPCYFNVAPIIVDGEKEGDKITLHSVGINNISFAVYKKKVRAEDALNQLGKFLLNKSVLFEFPGDR